MKQTLLLFLIFIVSSSLFSCEPVPDPTILEIDKHLIEAKHTGAAELVYIEANYEWTVSSSADWCLVTPSMGDNSVQVFQVIVQNNSDYSSRECTISVVSKEKTQTISVKQAQYDVLYLDNSTVSISNAEQIFVVTINTNVAYDVASEADWIKMLGTKTLSSNKIEFQAEANETMSSRKGTIRIKQRDGSLERVATITQKQKDSLIVSIDSVSFGWESSSATIPVTANIDFKTLVSDNCSWLHVERKGNGMDYELSISVDSFILTPSSDWDLGVPFRSGTITITDGNIVKHITINQRYKDYIWISQNDYSLYINNSFEIIAYSFLHEGIDKTLNWTSSNEKVASVNNGIVSALSKGQATITVSNADNSYSETCIVTVKDPIDDIYIVAQGSQVTSLGGYSTLNFHSRIFIPSVFNSIEFYSVWLCQPNGQVQEIKGTIDGYVIFSTISYNAGFDQKAADYFSSWYVLYQVAIDGVNHDFYTNLNAHRWGPINW